jgi:hypothetical protein
MNADHDRKMAARRDLFERIATYDGPPVPCDPREGSPGPRSDLDRAASWVLTALALGAMLATVMMLAAALAWWSVGPLRWAAVLLVGHLTAAYCLRTIVR